MMSRTIALAVVLASATASVAHAERPSPPPPPQPPTAGNDHHFLQRLVAFGIAAGVYATWEFALKDTLSPSACRWCTTPGFDNGVRESLHWAHPQTADKLSAVTGFAAGPLALGGLLIASTSGLPERQLQIGDDLLAMGEAIVYSELAINAIKYTAGRQRPYAHYTTAGSEYPATNDDNLSFASGHSAFAFAAATAAGEIAHARHSKLEPAIWAVGMTLATATGYLRIAADKHYFSDVVGGAVVGVAAGLLVPRITGSLPHDTVLVPTNNGIALSGTF